jgi:hypothetical protein
VEIFYSTCSTFPEHSRQRRPKEIYLFRVLKCSRSFLPIIMFVLLMMPHVGPMIDISSESPTMYALPTYPCKVKSRNNIDQSYVYVDNFWEKCCCLILILVKKSEKTESYIFSSPSKGIFPIWQVWKFSTVLAVHFLSILVRDDPRKFIYSEFWNVLVRFYDKHQEHLLCVKHGFKLRNLMIPRQLPSLLRPLLTPQ